MAKIAGQAGTPYLAPQETWEPTMHLAFFKVPFLTEPADKVRILHQLWRSNLGRQVWRPVPEMDPHSPDNE